MERIFEVSRHSAVVEAENGNGFCSFRCLRMTFLGNTARGTHDDRAQPAKTPPRFGRSHHVDRAGGSTGWVCLMLAFLGFGGGLSMALLGFNSSAEPVRISGVRSELRYLPPGEAMLTAAAPRGSSGHAEAESTRRADASAIEAFAGLDSSVQELRDSATNETFELANVNGAFDRLGALSIAQSSSSANSAIAGISAPSGGNSEPGADAAFAAVVTPVPEPSTWLLMLGGAAVLVAKVRRRVSR